MHTPRNLRTKTLEYNFYRFKILRFYFLENAHIALFVAVKLEDWKQWFEADKIDKEISVNNLER